MNDAVAARLALSLENDALVFLVGAGLSFAEPSAVPLAADLAADWATDYETKTGAVVLAEAHRNLEALANFFLGLGQLNRASILDCGRTKIGPTWDTFPAATSPDSSPSKWDPESTLGSSLAAVSEEPSASHSSSQSTLPALGPTSTPSSSMIRCSTSTITARSTLRKRLAPSGKGEDR
jgi:hypothetical protein